MPFTINSREIGPGRPPFIIAEMSANHGGDIEQAKAIISMAKKSGADAVKMQSYTPDTITIDHDSADFKITGGLWHGETLYSLYEKAHTPFEWHEPLFNHAKQVGITLFSAPFDVTAVELLESLNAPAYKIASLELVDIPLIEYVARTGKPIIMSTGTADISDIERALDAVIAQGNNNIALLYCVSAYPTPAKDMHLNTMVDMAKRFDVHIGLSDHSLGTNIAVAATALGACLIEKHVTLNRSNGGPDASFSLEPSELSRLIKDTRETFEALGCVRYGPKPSERPNAKFRRSLYAIRDIAEGEQFTHENTRSIRPGFGLPPYFLNEVLGACAKSAIPRGTPISFDHFR